MAELQVVLGIFANEGVADAAVESLKTAHPAAHQGPVTCSTT